MSKIVRQTNLNYSGTYWNAGGSNPRGPIDFSNYAYLNLDVWVPVYAGDYTLGVALLTSNEVKVDYTIDGGPAGWRTLTIPISDFANSEISSVDGIKFEPNPQGSIPIFYWDNLFAWGGSGDNTNTISVNCKTIYKSAVFSGINGADGESLFPHASISAPIAVGIFNRSRDCALLSTGTICTSVQCWRFNHLSWSL